MYAAILFKQPLFRCLLYVHAQHRVKFWETSTGPFPKHLITYCYYITLMLACRMRSLNKLYFNRCSSPQWSGVRRTGCWKTCKRLIRVKSLLLNLTEHPLKLAWVKYSTHVQRGWRTILPVLNGIQLQCKFLLYITGLYDVTMRIRR